MKFDYNASAEFFVGRGPSKRAPLNYQRFDQAANAIRFAMEDLDPALLRGSFLEIDETRYDGAEIEQLYASPAFPLPRGDRARERKQKR